MNTWFTNAVSLLGAAFFVGCAVPADSQEAAAGGEASEPSVGSAEDEADDVSAESVFTETIVTIDEHGNETVVSRPITLERELEEARLRAAIANGAVVAHERALDSFCYGNSEWLYDQPNLVGNRICFSHPVTYSDRHDLTAYPRGTIVCGGTTYTTYWAGGIAGCMPRLPPLAPIPYLRSNNTNSVRSIYTGLSNPSVKSGVWFYNEDNTPATAYTGVYVQHLDVTPVGRYVDTLGLEIH